MFSMEVARSEYIEVCISHNATQASAPPRAAGSVSRPTSTLIPSIKLIVDVSKHQVRVRSAGSELLVMTSPSGRTSSSFCSGPTSTRCRHDRELARAAPKHAACSIFFAEAWCVTRTWPVLRMQAPEQGWSSLQMTPFSVRARANTSADHFNAICCASRVLVLTSRACASRCSRAASCTHSVCQMWQHNCSEHKRATL